MRIRYGVMNEEGVVVREVVILGVEGTHAEVQARIASIAPGATDAEVAAALGGTVLGIEQQAREAIARYRTSALNGRGNAKLLAKAVRLAEEAGRQTGISLGELLDGFR